MSVYFFQSPELPPKIKEPTRAVVRDNDPTPAERARSCRNRLMELYGNNDTASDKLVTETPSVKVVHIDDNQTVDNIVTI